MRPIVQLSLDLTNLSDAFATAAMGVRAGVDWLEAGTPLILAEGARCVRELKARFPDRPVVADLKIMDGGYGEAEIMAKAGAEFVVVMGQAHAETVEEVVRAGHDYGIKIMGDNMGMPDPVTGAKLLEDLGCDYIIHHIGYDMRTLRRKRGQETPGPLDRLREVANAVTIPVQAVGGLTLQQAIDSPRFGAPMVVIGAPLAIDEHAFRAAANPESVLTEICERVHLYGDIT